jgi:hypothetical protein
MAGASFIAMPIHRSSGKVPLRRRSERRIIPINRDWTRVPMYRESPWAKSKELSAKSKEIAALRQLNRWILSSYDELQLDRLKSGFRGGALLV